MVFFCASHSSLVYTLGLLICDRDSTGGGGNMKDEAVASCITISSIMKFCNAEYGSTCTSGIFQERWRMLISRVAGIRTWWGRLPIKFTISEPRLLDICYAASIDWTKHKYHAEKRETGVMPHHYVASYHLHRFQKVLA
jgi:hypothetical protein